MGLKLCQVDVFFFCKRFLKRKVLGMAQRNGSCEWDEWDEYENLKLKLAIGKMAT